MSKLLLLDLLPVILSIATLGISLAYLIIRTPHTFRIKFVGIPIFLLVTFLTVTTLDSLIGRPLKMYPPDDFIPLGITVVAEPNAKIEDFKMDLWVRNKGEVSTRLYQIPYDAETLEKTQKAIDSMAESNVPVSGKWKLDTSGDSRVYKPVFKRWEVRTHMPRKPPPPLPDDEG